MFWAWNCHVLNLLSYCGLVDAKIRASDIDLPVVGFHRELRSELGNCMHWRLTALDTLGRVRAASEAAAGGWRAIVFTSDADDEVTISYPGLYHTLSAICEAARRRQHRWGQQARRGAVCAACAREAGGWRIWPKPFYIQVKGIGEE